jgi:integrase/recombinase XerC
MLFQHVEGFLDYLRVEKSASALTLVSYRTDLGQLFSFLAGRYSVSCDEITTDLINHKSVREYLAQMQEQGMSRSTMARKLAALRSFVRYLCRENILPNNPIAAVSTPKQDKRLPKFLYPLEIQILMDAPDTRKPLGLRDKAILETLYAAGLRVSELVGLNLNDVFFDEELIKVYGTSKAHNYIAIMKFLNLISVMLHDRMLPHSNLSISSYGSLITFTDCDNSGCVKHIILPPRMGVMVNLLNVFGSNVSIYLGSG